MALARSVAIGDFHLDPPSREERETLSVGSEEYREVRDLLLSLKGYRLEVKRIEALRNPKTYAQFAKNVELYKEKPGAQVMRLLHGTRPENVDGIFESNLLLSKISLEDTRGSRWYCGEGFYFTYSAAYARIDRFTGYGKEKHLLLFDVLVAKVARLPPGEMYPPEGIDTAQPEKEDYETYVKFEEGLFYPTHLIVCTQCD